MKLLDHRTVATSLATLACCVPFSLYAQQPSAPAPESTAGMHPKRIVRPGVGKEGISVQLSSLQPAAVIPVEGTPDWSTVTANGVWVSSARVNHVVQIVPGTNTVGVIADVERPCSGLAWGFDSIWAPSCGSHTLLRLDPATGKTIAQVAADPANSEGGITVGDGAVWIVVKPSTLVRIDPATNTATAQVELPSGSENPAFSDGFVWITSFAHDQLLKIDPSLKSIVAAIPVGPKPRFLTVGDGSIWTLNQGDGSVTRVDIQSSKVLATIPCGIPGPGGEITFGEGFVWATAFDFPLTRIDTKSNTVVKQWAGSGGDGIRFGLGSIWLSNLRQGNVWRIDPPSK